MSSRNARIGGLPSASARPLSKPARKLENLIGMCRERKSSEHGWGRIIRKDNTPLDSATEQFSLENPGIPAILQSVIDRQSDEAL